MIDSLKDLNLNSKDSVEEISNKLESVLQISVFQLTEALQSSIQNRADELAQEFNLIAPYGDYSKSLENKDDILKFLKEEASQTKNWSLTSIEEHMTNSNLIQFNFINTAIDEGDACTGVVLLSKSGKIRHAFAQV